MANEKKITAREAAQKVLSKVHEILAKSETLQKYQTENSPKLGVKYGSIEKDQKPVERDYSDYEVKSGKSLSSDQKREKKQISPSKNPKEEAEGNNKPDGSEPEYEFKDKIAANNAKEKKLRQLDKAEKNPDKEADARLGEKVEKDVEQHFKENKEAEAKEGHKLMVKSDGKTKHDRCVEHVEENSPEVSNPHAVCSSVGVPRGKSEEMEGEKAFIPAALVGSAKLAKFMERKHAKRKAAQGRESQASEAVGHEAKDAPAPRSNLTGEPEERK
jgi:hypothetical protein